MAKVTQVSPGPEGVYVRLEKIPAGSWLRNGNPVPNESHLGMGVYKAWLCSRLALAKYLRKIHFTHGA